MLNFIKTALSKKDEADISVGESLFISVLFVTIMVIPYVLIYGLYFAGMSIAAFISKKRAEKKAQKTPKES